MRAQNSDNGQESDTVNARARANGSRSKLIPEKIRDFLELLRGNGNVTMSARLVGMSRSTIYAFASDNAPFKEAMKDALTEGRELLVGAAWQRATNWEEYKAQDDSVHVKPPSDRLLAILVQGYFQQFKPGRDEALAPDELLPETADLTQLSDRELDTLEELLSKAGVEDRVGARED